MNQVKITVGYSNNPGDRVYIMGAFLKSREQCETLLNKLDMEDVFRVTTLTAGKGTKRYYRLQSSKDTNLDETLKIYRRAVDQFYKAYPDINIGKPSKKTMQYLSGEESQREKVSQKEDKHISNISQVIKFDDLPTPKRGNSRGDGTQARKIVANIAERAVERESKVKLIIQGKWPEPEYRVEDNTAGAGADFLIWRGNTLVARADAKSSMIITRRQRKEAFKDDVPYWLVGTTKKIEVTKKSKFIAESWKVYPE